MSPTPMTCSEPEPKRIDLRRPLIENYGDECQLHVMRGWGRKEVFIAEAVRYVTEQVGEEYAQDYLDFAEPPVRVHRGWARFVPPPPLYGDPHALDEWDGDGGCLLSRGLLPPFSILITFKDGKLIVRRDSDLPWVPATWLYDH